MDWAERAALNEAVFRETALARVGVNAPPANATGLCLECGTPIPAARLQAIPNAAYCVACQVLFEAHPPHLP
ncbi:TraR/DksA C4-type zinc finger protein [Stenoxybacter acetivorans]|uniref:TraR/DksA C4-type zinc finger protein n=1 Tax=Stenoxybacter acetivorans TaxID=422441 RepID=UPI000561FDCD|nr:TraR/DksA C4-type zinc finger protein [Stenoxybacter acetivorans]